MPIALRYDVTTEDLQALRWFYIRRYLGRWYFRVQFLMGLFLFPCTCAGVVASLRVGRSSTLLYEAVAAGFAGGLLWVGLYRFQMKRDETTFVKHRAEAAGGVHDMTIDKAGLHEVGPHSSASHQWSAVRELHSTSTHLFVVVAGGGVYTIPTRGMSPSLVEEAAGTIRAALERSNEAA